MPSGALTALGVAILAVAGVLATCGAVTAVLLAQRMAARQYLMPVALRIPLPAAMVPDFPAADSVVSAAPRPG